MKLYHGTSIAALPSILKNGIRARKPDGPSNWTEYPSRPGYTYMTTAYAGYFSVMSTAKGQPMVFAIVEVESDLLKQRLLCPDEDFIGKVRSVQEKISLKQATNECNPIDYQQNWKLSIEKLGNCCYFGNIPKRAITRYAVIELEKNPAIGMLFLDPTISIMNYSIMKQKYTSLMAHIFDGEVIYDDRVEWATKFTNLGEDLDQFAKFGKEAIEYQQKMQELRNSCIKVTDLRGEKPVDEFVFNEK